MNFNLYSWFNFLLCISEEGGRIRKCNFRDTDECLFYFTYEYDESNNVIIKVQRTKGESMHAVEM